MSSTDIPVEPEPISLEPEPEPVLEPVPEIKNEIKNDSNDFEVLMSSKVNGLFPVTKYRSKSTGLTLVHAQVPGPIVHGYIALATKPEDEDGLSHTLEHLVFFGSEDYPYPHVLDVCASKSLADGTNAWTAPDHTAFCIDTAGSEGFCQILPVYLDHIFYPLLPESSFLTEIYHINGKGQDSGVVYSEMQNVENQGENLAEMEMRRHLYPNSGYRFEFGGIMKNLRESTSLEKIRAFHKKYYNSKNACIIVCGIVEPSQLFTACDPIIQKILKKGDVPETWTRPFVNLTEISDLKWSIEKTIHFPSDEEDEVLISIGFLGPSNLDQLEQIQAISLVLGYLLDSSVAPLQKAFVEDEDPMASSISSSDIPSTRVGFHITIEQVPKKKIKYVLPLMRKILEEQITEMFDLSRMKDIIRKHKIDTIVEMENNLHDSISHTIISDFLFGEDDPERFKKRLNTTDIIDSLLSKESYFWQELIKDSILLKPWVNIVAISSPEEQKKLNQSEKTRNGMRIIELGKDGLKAKSDQLESALKLNSIPAPESIIRSIKTPDPSSITFHKINQFEDPDFASCDCKVFLDDVPTNFILVSVLMDTTQVKEEDRRYLPIFSEALTESPIKLEDGTVMNHDWVVAGLNRDLISIAASFGIDGHYRFRCGGFGHIFALDVKFELDKVKEGFEWIRNVLWNVQWKAERLKVLANKMSSDITSFKRDGNYIAYHLLEDLLFKNDSNVKAIGCFRQQAFLKDLNLTLSNSNNKSSRSNNACLCIRSVPCMKPAPAAFKKFAIFEILDDIRDVILKPSNMAIQIVCNRGKIQEKGINLSEHLQKTFRFEQKGTKRFANQFDYFWMKDFDDLMKKPREIILGVGGEESGYLYVIIPGVKSYDNPDIPALTTALVYFWQAGGPFYKAIRGGGFAYGFVLGMRVSEGLIYFKLERCTDTIGGYTAAKNVIKSHLEDDNLWNEDTLASAKSSLIFELVSHEETPMGLAATSIYNHFHNVQGDYGRKLIEKVWKVELEEVKIATRKYIGDLFLKKNNCVVVCPKDKVKKNILGFKSCDKKLEAFSSLNTSGLSKWPKSDGKIGGSMASIASANSSSALDDGNKNSKSGLINSPSF